MLLVVQQLLLLCQNFKHTTLNQLSGESYNVII